MELGNAGQVFVLLCFLLLFLSLDMEGLFEKLSEVA